MGPLLSRLARRRQKHAGQNRRASQRQGPTEGKRRKGQTGRLSLNRQSGQAEQQAQHHPQRQAGRQKKKRLPQTDPENHSLGCADHPQSGPSFLPPPELDGTHAIHSAEGQKGAACHKHREPLTGSGVLRVSIGIFDPGGVLRAVQIRDHRNSPVIAAEQLDGRPPAGGQAFGPGKDRIHRQIAIHRPIGIVGGQHAAEGIVEENRVAVAVCRPKRNRLPQLIRGPNTVQHRGGHGDFGFVLRQAAAQQFQPATGKIPGIRCAQRTEGQPLFIDQKSVLFCPTHGGGVCLLDELRRLGFAQGVARNLPLAIDRLAGLLHGHRTAAVIAEHSRHQGKRCRQDTKHHPGGSPAAFQALPCNVRKDSPHFIHLAFRLPGRQSSTIRLTAFHRLTGGCVFITV